MSKVFQAKILILRIFFPMQLQESCDPKLKNENKGNDYSNVTLYSSYDETDSHRRKQFAQTCSGNSNSQNFNTGYGKHR